jgi:phage tail-like protein
MPIDSDGSAQADASVEASASAEIDASAEGGAGATTDRPFTTFNFRVRIKRNGDTLCDAAFSECDGLEMTMEPKTHREGGNTRTQYQLAGPVTYGNLTLRRGMTETDDLWDWFYDVTQRGGYGKRADAEVEMLASDRGGDANSTAVNARFTLRDCLPVKLRAPSLAASDGGVAIEELQVAYERLESRLPGAPSG